MNRSVVALGHRLAPHALPLAMLVAMLAFAAAEPTFLRPENLLNVVRQTALVGIMAVAMTFVIMTGGIDLSIGPVLALSGLIAVFSLDAGLPLPLALLAALGVVRGTALILGGPDLHSIREQEGYAFIGTGSLFGIPFPVCLFLGATLLLVFVQRMTPMGLKVAAIGDNERAAYLSGHRTRLTKMALYGICGMGAALAGIVQTSQVHTAAATYGPFGTELDVVAAVVVGGTSLMGGNGSIAHTVLGVMFLGLLNNGMNILDVPIDMQLIAKGVVIVLAMAMAELK
jgi:ribose/xylose/arabinose/galactoside ABC-type transport system permease subunit